MTPFGPESYNAGKENSETSEQNEPSIVPGSQCYHLRLGQQHYLPIASEHLMNDHLFALVIGIDNYRDEKIRDLRGCVNDSENMCRFLTESLHANPLHIKHLRNSEATRKGILSAFEEHFINNKDICQNDAIIFYFAGHGSYEYHPKESNLAGGKMETICPYDDRKGERGIPDRTLASLMRRLARDKGNNITAIFDSCHSGGMGRIPDSDIENSRFLSPPDSPFPTGHDDHIWKRDINSTAPRIANIICTTDPVSTIEIDDPYAPYPPLRSHVLLAACQHDDLAYKSYISSAGHVGGIFTSLLLDLLRQPGRNLAETTYFGLFHAMEQRENKLRLQKQTPYVEGDNKTRILFSMTDLGHQFSVLSLDDGSFLVAAGTIHGVDRGTEFAITSGKKLFEGLKPFKVSPLSCSFRNFDGLSLQDDSRAKVTKWNRPHSKVFLEGKSDGSPDSQEYDLAIFRSPGGRRNLERRDGLIPLYAEKVIPFPPGDDNADAVMIDAISCFNFHLQNSSGSNTIGEKLTVKLECLSPPPPCVSGSYRPVENGKDFFASGTLKQQSTVKSHKVTAFAELRDLSLFFSLTLSVRDVHGPLFPYVFAFDPSTYEIKEFYHPTSTKDGPLHDNGVVTIGYGPGTDDNYPIEFNRNEVTFFKVFVTSKYVDLKDIQQKAPFAARMPRRVLPIIELWESWVFVVKS